MSKVRTWPAGIAFSAAGSAWIFPEHGVIFTQTTTAEATPADVHALIDFFAWLASSNAAAVSAPTVIHDWRSLRGLSRECRSAFMTRRAEIEARPSRVYMAVQLNPVYRMALQTAMLGVQMLMRASPTQVVDDPFAVLVELGVGAPDPALHRRMDASFRERARR